MHFDSLMITAGKHKRSPYLIVVVHAGEVSPALVASDFNEALEKTGKKDKCVTASVHQIQQELLVQTGQMNNQK